MEIPFFILLCFLILSVLLITLGCAYLQTQLRPSNKQGKSELHVSFPTLPRKLRLTGKVTVAEQEGKDSSTYNNHKESALTSNQASHRELNCRSRAHKIEKTQNPIQPTHFRRWCSGSALY
ncbi:hypothetical protein TB1_017912 [Malus domestica]